MRLNIRVVLAGVLTAVLAMVGGVATASAAPPDDPTGTLVTGRPVINGDGDTIRKCLAISNNGAGPDVVMDWCNGTEHQNWVYVYGSLTISGRTWPGVLIYSGHPSWSNWCIAGGAEGAQLWMSQCRLDSTYWEPSNPVGGQWAQFENLFRHRYYGLRDCMDVKDGGLSYVVQTWTCKPYYDEGLANQLWKVA